MKDGPLTYVVNQKKNSVPYILGMLRTLGLLLPALIPSWAFFKAIEPSPRIQWRLLTDAAIETEPWRDFRPRPLHLSVTQMVLRLFWNPRWNETLYMVSLAERLTLTSSRHSLEEIQHILATDLACHHGPIEPTNLLQFQLLFIGRAGDELISDITYQSEARSLGDILS